MAGDKGKRRTSLPAGQRGGEERGPKIRKVIQEETGKRKRDKPMKQGKKKVSAEEWADFAKRMTEKKVAYFQTIVDQDCEHLYIPEELLAYWPSGPDATRELNARTRQEIKGFKEFAAERIKEYQDKGYLEGYPECRIDPHVIKLIKD